MQILSKNIEKAFAPVAWVMQGYTPSKQKAPSYGTFFRPQNARVFVKARKMLSFVDNKVV